MIVGELNTLELILVLEDLVKRKVTNYTIRQGNDCLWVSTMFVDMYYKFNEGKLIDVIVD